MSVTTNSLIFLLPLGSECFSLAFFIVFAFDNNTLSFVGLRRWSRWMCPSTPSQNFLSKSVPQLLLSSRLSWRIILLRGAVTAHNWFKIPCDCFRLDCSSNRLKELPESLGRCLDLSDLKVAFWISWCFFYLYSYIWFFVAMIVLPS